MKNEEYIPQKDTAPYFEILIKQAQSDPIVKNQKCYEMLLKLIEETNKIEIQGDDERRSLWFPLKRGEIEDFGNFQEYLDEEIVSIYSDFVDLWEYYYPEEIKWYDFTVCTYKKEYYFYVDSVLTFHLQPNQEFESQYYENDELINWISDNVSNIIFQLSTDAAEYNQSINNNLSYQKRIGKILRSDYWDIYDDEKLAFRAKINEEELDILQKVVEQSAFYEPENFIPQMTASLFFDYCKMGYTANNYFDNSKETISSIEMYDRMSDGRDCGLKEIDVDSETAFLGWYNNESRCGGHPWEICRGGNSTHISLYVHRKENGWYLRLAGSSSSRVVETALFAVALHNNNVVFKLEKAQEIYNMLTGKDSIGIVPHNVTPRYCHNLFPDNDKIIDFMNLGHEDVSEFIAKTHWYPESEIRLANITLA